MTTALTIKEQVYYKNYVKLFKALDGSLKDNFISAHEELSHSRSVRPADVERAMRSMVAMAHASGLEAKSQNRPMYTMVHTYGNPYGKIEGVVPDMARALTSAHQIGRFKGPVPDQTQWKSLPVTFERYNYDGTYVLLIALDWNSPDAAVLKAAGEVVGFDVRPIDAVWLEGLV